jgi:diguanylate cyclase (GGDEF)-like protein
MVRATMVRPPLVWGLVGLDRLRQATLGALIAATAVAAIVLWHEVVHDLAPLRAEIPWWALAAGFAFTELFVVHAHVRGSAHSLSLSEIPLVLGLLLADPDELMLAAVVGPAVVLVATRQDPVRLVFNLAQLALTAAVATVVLHALGPAALGPEVWMPVFAAVLFSSATAAVLVFCAIGLAEGGIPSRRVAGMLGADLVVAMTNASVALGGATVVAQDAQSALLLLPPAAMLLLAYRAYASERAKHDSLEFLYGVTRSLSRGSGELETELLDLLRRTRASFRVQTAEVVLLSEEGGLRTSRGPGGDEVMVPVSTADVAALREAVQDDHAVLVDELGDYLARRDISQALIAPVRGETRLVGVMVLGDRVGATSSFGDEDLRLFEALATHAGLSLELDRLERAALSDPLTGLANRTLFLRRVEASLARDAGMATVLFLDLDDFKAINDRCGHAGGDAVLVAAAGRIEASVRPGDVAARMGGDEFAVLLEDVDDHHGEQVGARVLDLLAEPVVADGEQVWVRSSVGIATAAAGSIDAGGLLNRADMAMYGAKAAGKGQLRVWFPEMEPAGEGAATGRDELAAGLANGELVAHFQPIVCLATGAVVGAEALARWRHPRHGLLGAASFLRGVDAELARAMDREILFQACDAAAAGGGVPTVHVNLAFLDAATVRDVLEATRLEPARLVLELGEAALRVAPAGGLAALRSLGVQIAFGDFGAGPDALAVARSTALDVVKVPRPFVDGTGRAGHERSVLAMVVQVGELLGVRVVVEGIEREDQREALLELGCSYGQGYLLGRPLPLSGEAQMPPGPPSRLFSPAR